MTSKVVRSYLSCFLVIHHHDKLLLQCSQLTLEEAPLLRVRGDGCGEGVDLGFKRGVLGVLGGELGLPRDEFNRSVALRFV